MANVLERAKHQTKLNGKTQTLNETEIIPNRLWKGHTE